MPGTTTDVGGIALNKTKQKKSFSSWSLQSSESKLSN